MMRKAWWLLAAATIAGGAWALDPPRPAPAPSAQPAADKDQPAPAPAPEPAATTAAPAQEPAEQAVEDETLPPLSPEARRTGPTPQRFDPTEEVRADFPVSFPSDI
jgi:hypothetical protein